MRPPRLYVYNLTTDNNGAPCLYDGVLSLAICKPGIRTTAQVGDLIFGFAGTTLHPDKRLVYVARVTDIVEGCDYYANGRYSRRPDSVYQFTDRHYCPRLGACYHGKGEERRVDLGSGPEHKRAVVLMSRDFRYLGGDGSAVREGLEEVKRCLETLRRGHRVNHSTPLVTELETLKRELWRDCAQSEPGAPSKPPPTPPCD